MKNSLHEPLPSKGRAVRSLSNAYKRLKCVLVGDACTEKTKVVIKYTLGENNTCRTDRGHADAIENYSATLKVDDILVEFDLWDAADNDDAKEVRTVCYAGAHVFLLFFSCVTPASLQTVRGKWAPEVVFHCPDVPWVLVGTHSDERAMVSSANGASAVVSTEQGQELAHTLGATYVEIGHLGKGDETKQLFERAIRIALHEKSVGMKARERLVEGILGEAKHSLESKHRELGLALWRGDQGKGEDGMQSVEELRRNIEQWEKVVGEVSKAAKLDPSAPEDTGKCVVQ